MQVLEYFINKVKLWFKSVLCIVYIISVIVDCSRIAFAPSTADSESDLLLFRYVSCKQAAVPPYMFTWTLWIRSGDNLPTFSWVNL